MFSFRRPKPDDLLSSQLFDEKCFYAAFSKDLRHCKKQVVIESPYMTNARVDMLKPILKKLVKRGVKVRINTRFPEHHDTLLRIQSYQATKTLKSIGVQVWYFHDYLHRKIAVLDGQILYEGSLNILSQNRSREIMRRIESVELTRQIMSFLGMKRFYW